MSEIQWGPEIEVYGERPEWLGDDCNISISQRDGEWHGSLGGVTARYWAWVPIKKIRLPADHPHYAMLELQAMGQEAEWTPDERTVRACIEALPKDSGVLNLSDPPQRTSRDMLLDECRAALEALLPRDPAKALAEEWLMNRPVGVKSSQALVDWIYDIATTLIETGRISG